MSITPSEITTGYTTTIGGVLYDLGDLFAAPTTGTLQQLIIKMLV